MTEILNFAGPQQAFGPEAIDTLSRAVDEAWEKIKKSGSRFAKPGYAGVAREIVARRIFELAQAGERDYDKLSADAVRFLTMNYIVL